MLRVPDRLLDVVFDYVLAAEEAFAGGAGDQPGAFQLEVGALNLALVHAELLGERGGRGERCAGGELAGAYARLDLGADLEVDGAFGERLELDVHARFVPRCDVVALMVARGCRST